MSNEDTSLIQCLKNDIDHARRNRDTETVTVLSTFLSEVAPSGNEKAMNNDAVKKAVKKWTDNIEETLTKYDIPQERKDKLVNEMNILSDYLPNQLSVEDIKSEVEMIIQEQSLDTEDKKTFGMIMKTLNQKHGSSVDGKVAKEIVERRLWSNV